MSWFWGSSAADDNKDADPLRKLDPDLKRFLEKEAPDKYQPAANDTRDAQAAQANYRDQAGLEGAAVDANAQAPPAERPLPKESLFPDGRYKDIWATYRPQKEVEDAGKSDHERLMDILHGYKERKASVGRAALENCAEEQWAVSECFRSGNWNSRLTMCKAENRAMDRCYAMQSRFLKALGYMSLYDRGQDVQDAIQMHAHALYQKMLKQERLIKEAKERGEEPPVFEPIIPEKNPMNDPTAESTGVFANLPKPDQREGLLRWEKLSDAAKEKLTKKRFQKLSPQDQELELRALEGELAVDEVVAMRLGDHYKRERQERLAREREGRERMSDKVKRWFDWRDWESVDKMDQEEAEKSQK